MGAMVLWRSAVEVSGSIRVGVNVQTVTGLSGVLVDGMLTTPHEVRVPWARHSPYSIRFRRIRRREGALIQAGGGQEKETMMDHGIQYLIPDHLRIARDPDPLGQTTYATSYFPFYFLLFFFLKKKRRQFFMVVGRDGVGSVEAFSPSGFQASIHHHHHHPPPPPTPYTHTRAHKAEWSRPASSVVPG
ncbi:hypothetical protein B0J12DRAFT_262099 [Macrophomina phaseolina]|uniref:Uncharacterized protein n=1 Tax=Macrophomina phaseolina TaxID=35725 RepID=A0ABQ8FZ47_9PEZI|nr:hypothetical protein B0J12DRAFT_262099 [Macrophomina phaseolina]